jgi:lactaldehyde dehydrogenase/glycolaldehyde dehydrogenase
VITNADPSLAIIREEVFAPVIPVVKVDSFDEAMHLANDCLYGLAAYVFSTNYRSIMRAVDDVNFGELYVNRTIGESLVAYHGGWRQSGIGGEDGKYGVLAYTQIKSVYHRFG